MPIHISVYRQHIETIVSTPAPSITCATDAPNRHRLSWSATLSRSLVLIAFTFLLICDTCRALLNQSTTPVSSNSSATVESLQEQRRAAEASQQHNEVARIDRLILNYLCGRLRDLEQEKGQTEIAEMFDRESAKPGNMSEQQAFTLAKQLASPGKSKTLDRREQELMIQLGATYNSLGTAFVHMNQFLPALDAYRVAAAWWPQTPGLSRNLGLIDAQTDQAEEAVWYLAPILHANPDDTDTRFALAMSLSALNRQQEVLDALKPVSAELQKKPAVAYIYGQALMATGDRAGAQTLLAGLTSRPMAPGIAFLVGRTLVVLGDDSDALTALRAAEESDRIPRLYYFEAMVRLRLNQPSEAILLLEKQLTMTPGDIEAEYALAFTQLSGGDITEATKHLQNVLRADPNHPDANYEYGKLQLASGDVAEGITHLETAEKFSPNQLSIHYQLQLAYRKAGRTEDARRELKLYNAQKAIGNSQSDGLGNDHR